MKSAADKPSLRSIIIRPIDLRSRTIMIDRIMASIAPTRGAASLANVGAPSPMRRIVVEPEAAPADADEPDPSVPLQEASRRPARKSPHFLNARTTRHPGGFSQEYPDPDEHAHSECGERPKVDSPLCSDADAHAFRRAAMVAAAMDKAHGDGCAGCDAANFAFGRIVAHRQPQTLLDRDCFRAAADRWRYPRIELVPSPSPTQLR